MVFDSLSQETRLRVFRILVKQGKEGAAAGVLSEKLGIPHNTLSFHLSHMSNAGLAVSRREGRSIIYTVNFELVQDLIRFMIEDCCNGEFLQMKGAQKPDCMFTELSNLPGCCEK